MLMATATQTAHSMCYTAMTVTPQVRSELLRSCGTDTCLQDWSQKLSNCTIYKVPGLCRAGSAQMCCNTLNNKCSPVPNLICIQEYDNTTWYIVQTKQNIVINTTIPVQDGDQITLTGAPCTYNASGFNYVIIGVAICIALLFICVLYIGFRTCLNMSSSVVYNDRYDYYK